MEKIFLGALRALALCVFLEVALLAAAPEVRLFGWILVALITIDALRAIRKEVAA